MRWMILVLTSVLLGACAGSIRPQAAPLGSPPPREPAPTDRAEPTATAAPPIKPMASPGFQHRGGRGDRRHGDDRAVSDASNVGGCEPACQLPLVAQNVNVTGKVYAPAVAAVTTGSLDFGIVHVGDVVPTVGIVVSNAADVGALNDTLSAFASVSDPFSGAGSIAGLGAGQDDGVSMRVGLDTTAAGVFDGTAELEFASRNPDMSDLDLAPFSVTLAAQVNNYANPEIVRLAGGAELSRS